MSKVNLTNSKVGVLFPVRARPRAKRNQIEGVREGVLVVSITAAPADGAANDAILELLAKNLRCAKSTLAVARGSHSRDKMISVALLDSNAIHRRLDEILSDASNDD